MGSTDTLKAINAQRTKLGRSLAAQVRANEAVEADRAELDRLTKQLTEEMQRENREAASTPVEPKKRGKKKDEVGEPAWTS